jgi:hypothetical protein
MGRYYITLDKLERAKVKRLAIKILKTSSKEELKRPLILEKSITHFISNKLFGKSTSLLKYANSKKTQKDKTFRIYATETNADITYIVMKEISKKTLCQNSK